MASSVFALHRIVGVCRLSLHEKGKKRAKCGKCLILGSLIRATLRISLRSGKPRLNARFDKRSRAACLSESEHGAWIEQIATNYNLRP
jgi:hypothetical protein